jgi:hypothetical protein
MTVGAQPTKKVPAPRALTAKQSKAAMALVIAEHKASRRKFALSRRAK